MRTLKNAIFFLALSFSTHSFLFAQSQSQMTDEMVVRQKEGMLFKASKLTSPQLEILEVVGLGMPSFTVSNMADGTQDSYSHSLRVTYSLQINGGRAGFQVVFYGLNDKIPYAVAQEGNLTSVFMPYQVHEHLKGRIEQALAARRKVQLKINLLPSGLREATWVIN